MLRRFGIVALALAGFAAVASPALVAASAAQDKAKTEDCRYTLGQLYKLQFNYQIIYGGRDNLMPTETGRDFWLALTRTNPPLIQAKDTGLLCPVRGLDRAGSVDYRGPTSDVNNLAPTDVVGADIAGNHGEGRGGSVLRKDGSVCDVEVADALWKQAERQVVSAVNPIPANEKSAVAALREIATAEADFRSNDRDDNRRNDFWVGDVHGLHAICPGAESAAEPQVALANAIRLIRPELAAADTAPLRMRGSLAPPAAPQPFNGYLFRALPQVALGDGAVPYATKGHGNPGQFGFIASPAIPGGSGKFSFVVTEDMIIWAKELAGPPLAFLPATPAAAGWTRLP